MHEEYRTNHLLSYYCMYPLRNQYYIVPGRDKRVEKPLFTCSFSRPWSPLHSYSFQYSEEASGRPTFHHDTYRALLPCEPSAQNTKLRKSSGPALVVNQRIGCARPLLFNLSTRGGQANLRTSGPVGMDPGTFPGLERQDAKISYCLRSSDLSISSLRSYNDRDIAWEFF